ncbi:SpoIIE family protein phosphatase [Streptomyces sp. NBC_00370]|uniref:PP2C family protein-serine/threonine phosphatase n=1 Tax=Streptomyces sp. NBC_00370 TaxID=2975728 RepID=UPI003FA721E3
MVISTRTESDAGSSTSVSWRGAPYPVLVADTRGTLVFVNEAAGALLPRARAGAALDDVAPDWLSLAHEIFRPSSRDASQETPATDVVRGAVGERSFEAHPTVQAARTAEGNRTVAWWLVEDTDHRLAREALRMERAHTELLARSSNLLLSSLNLERCMDVTAQMAAAHLADAALVIATPRAGRLPVVTCLRGGTPAMSHPTVDPDDVPGLSEALQGFPPVPSRWLDPDLAPSWLVPEGFGTVGSIVITPLPGHGMPAGALVLLRRSDTPAFTEREEVFARLFAARAGAAMSAARLYAEQSAISEVLMRELLPPALHQVGGVDFAGGYRPSGDHERIGGDFYDVHPSATEGEASLAVLGDVCGKGLEAAVLTGKIRNTLHALLPMADDHQQMLTLLNTSLLNSHHTRFATLVLASALRQGHEVQLRLTSAGHLAPLILRAGGEVEEADTHGTLVGAIPDARSHTTALTLAPGETCVLYTDGITEARGGPLGETLFGEKRLRRTLSECAGMPAEGIVERVQMLASEWVGDGRHDDMAVVVISAPRTHHLSAVNGRTRGRYTA